MNGMITSTFLLLIAVIQNRGTNGDTECLKLDVSITQKVENEGFHRDIRWLIEASSPSLEVWINTACKLCLRLDVSPGMYVYPDEVAELNRTKKDKVLNYALKHWASCCYKFEMNYRRSYKTWNLPCYTTIPDCSITLKWWLLVHIEGNVDVEAPAHEATEHTAYIYLNNSSIDRISISLPVHLRYQRSQITGGFGKVPLQKPSLLLWCPDSLSKICGRGLKVEAPCDESAQSICVWKNLTYQALFDEVELFVPVGDLDDYPLVSIVTLLLGCAGCIYILSVLSTTPL